MTEVPIPYGLASSGVPSRAVKVYAAMAAHGWEKNIRTEDVAVLAGGGGSCGCFRWGAVPGC